MVRCLRFAVEVQMSRVEGLKLRVEGVQMSRVTWPGSYLEDRLVMSLPSYGPIA